MRFRTFAVAPALILVVAACTGSGSSPSPSFPASSPSAASASGSVQRVEVKLSDALRMEPAALTVKVGQPITFVVTNTGAVQHEFYLGDEAAQQAHEKEMAAMGAMGMDEPDGIVLKAGETMELTHTFPSAGAYTAGCHETGHYPGGMRSTITVTE